MNKHHHQHQLSPERYIRTKARTLPIGTCYVSANWRQTGNAIIIVPRIHINNNVTHGAFLVDLYCLGVKESYWQFNQPQLEYKEYIDRLMHEDPFEVSVVPADYVLVHNIIYGALEFAGEIGFQPHKSFELTKYILEEDDEHVKLIDIEFGFKGKPLYISSPMNPGEKNRVMSHLYTRLGKGNYYFITEEEAEGFFEKENAENAPDYQDPEVKRNMIKDFIALTTRPGKAQLKKPGELGNILEAADEIFHLYIAKEDELKKASEIIAGLFDFRITRELFSDEMLFGKSEGRAKQNEIRREAERVHKMLAHDDKAEAGMKIAENLIQKYPGIPVFEYLYLKFMELKTGLGQLSPIIKIRLDKDPDYIPYIYMYAASFILNKPNDVESRQIADSLHLKNISPGRNSFCIEEVLLYIHLLNLNYYASGNFVMVEGLLSFMEFHHPELMPENEWFQAKIAIVTYVREWCDKWIAENN